MVLKGVVVSQGRHRIGPRGFPGQGHTGHRFRGLLPEEMAVAGLAARAPEILSCFDHCQFRMATSPSCGWGFGQLHSQIADLQALTGFISVTYDGSFAQWREFMDNSAMLPALFSGISMDFDYGQSFRYQSSRFKFSLNGLTSAVTRNSELMLDLTFFNDLRRPRRTSWSPRGKQSNTGLAIFRNMRPAESMNDNAKSWWDKIEHGRHPVSTPSPTARTTRCSSAVRL